MGKRKSVVELTKILGNIIYHFRYVRPAKLGHRFPYVADDMCAANRCVHAYVDIYGAASIQSLSKS
jgi:hypothetical protein